MWRCGDVAMWQCGNEAMLKQQGYPIVSNKGDGIMETAETIAGGWYK